MPERRTAQVEVLARDALNKVPRPYSEDIILNVFEVIEQDEELKARYDQLESELTKAVLNAWVGVYTKELTGLQTVREVDAPRDGLIKSYTKLRAS